MSDKVYAKHDHRSGGYIPPELLTADLVEDLIYCYGPLSGTRGRLYDLLIEDGIDHVCIVEQYKIKHSESYLSLHDIIIRGLPIDKTDLKERIVFFKGFCEREMQEQKKREEPEQPPQTASIVEYELEEVSDGGTPTTTKGETIQVVETPSPPADSQEKTGEKSQASQKAAREALGFPKGKHKASRRPRAAYPVTGNAEGHWGFPTSGPTPPQSEGSTRSYSGISARRVRPPVEDWPG
jgi:hypothetical protein